MSNRLVQDDSLVPRVIKEVADELNLKEGQVKYIIQHFFKWQREAFNDLEYSQYLWNYFGTFSIIPDRYSKYINSEKYKKQQIQKESQEQLTIKEDNNVKKI